MPDKKQKEAKVLEIKISNMTEPVRLLRVEMDQTDNWYYSELDAIEMVGVWDNSSDSPSTPNEKESRIQKDNFECDEESAFLDKLPVELIHNIMRKLNLNDKLAFSSTSKKLRSALVDSR